MLYTLLIQMCLPDLLNFVLLCILDLYEDYSYILPITYVSMYFDVLFLSFFHFLLRFKTFSGKV